MKNCNSNKLAAHGKAQSFTTERAPSLYVQPDKGFYKCFSTGEGGDLFSFIMKLENIEFLKQWNSLPNALTFNSSYDSGGPDLATQCKSLFELHELVSEWFHQQLLECCS